MCWVLENIKRFLFLPLFKLKVNGESEGATLEGVEDDKEYQISLSALYADGAQSEAVAIRYSTCEYISHMISIIKHY